MQKFNQIRSGLVHSKTASMKWFSYIQDPMGPLLIRVLHICLYTLVKCELSRLRTDGHTESGK